MHKLTLLISAAAILPAQDFDILIRNGRIVDGTGNPSFMGDVGIKDKRIAALGRISGKTAARTIDANGLVVAPGFIDMHNHSDEAILSDGNAESMIRMGVTSMILGEGSSARQRPVTSASAITGRLSSKAVSRRISVPI